MAFSQLRFCFPFPFFVSPLEVLRGFAHGAVEKVEASAKEVELWHELQLALFGISPGTGAEEVSEANQRHLSEPQILLGV